MPLECILFVLLIRTMGVWFCTRAGSHPAYGCFQGGVAMNFGLRKHPPDKSAAYRRPQIRRAAINARTEILSPS
jgi:hypothetical protein